MLLSYSMSGALQNGIFVVTVYGTDPLTGLEFPHTYFERPDGSLTADGLERPLICLDHIDAAARCRGMARLLGSITELGLTDDDRFSVDYLAAVRRGKDLLATELASKDSTNKPPRITDADV